MSRKMLKQIRIAAPCPASWHSMEGDSRVRFCAHCQLNVYNISEMSAPEAADLIKSHEGRLCIRMYQRADGTLLTRNCPVGLMEMRRRLAYAISFVFVLAFGAFGIAMGKLHRDDGEQRDLLETSRSWPVVGRVVDILSPRVAMGDIASPMTGKIAPIATTKGSSRSPIFGP